MYEPADIIIYVQEKGIVLKEKSVMAFQKTDGKIVAFGTEAERLEGTNTDAIEVMSPLRQGKIEDFTVAAGLFSLLLTKALGKKPLFKHPMAVCVPKGMTPVEKKAMEEVMISAGAGKVMTVDIPAAEFIRGFPDKFPKEYKKFKWVVGITKEEPERYVEEMLKDILAYADRERISRERVYDLLRVL